MEREDINRRKFIGKTSAMSLWTLGRPTSNAREDRRDQLLVAHERELHLTSPTIRVQAYAEDPTKAVILDNDAEQDDAYLTVDLRKPTQKKIKAPLRQLQHDNFVHFTGPFTSESFLLERLVGPSDCRATLRWHDRRPDPNETDWYYVRVLQHNNHMAWSSPVWVG